MLCERCDPHAEPRVQIGGKGTWEKASRREGCVKEREDQLEQSMCYKDMEQVGLARKG